MSETALRERSHSVSANQPHATSNIHVDSFGYKTTSESPEYEILPPAFLTTNRKNATILLTSLSLTNDKAKEIYRFIPFASIHSISDLFGVCASRWADILERRKGQVSRIVVEILQTDVWAEVANGHPMAFTFDWRELLRVVRNTWGSEPLVLGSVLYVKVRIYVKEKKEC